MDLLPRYRQCNCTVISHATHFQARHIYSCHIEWAYATNRPTLAMFGRPSWHFWRCLRHIMASWGFSHGNLITVELSFTILFETRAGIKFIPTPYIELQYLIEMATWSLQLEPQATVRDGRNHVRGLAHRSAHAFMTTLHIWRYQSSRRVVNTLVNRNVLDENFMKSWCCFNQSLKGGLVMNGRTKPTPRPWLSVGMIWVFLYW